MMSNTALLIVDVQNDFCQKGTLVVPKGDGVVTPLNKVIARARENGWPIIASRDWHPRISSHFKPFGGLWPIHCVQNSPGAEFHPKLDLKKDCFVVSKGIRFGEQGYSAFDGTLQDGTLLGTFLKQIGVNQIIIGGLATDYCVKATVLDAVKHKLKTTVLIDACRAINIKPEDGQNAIKEMGAAGAIISTTQEVLKMSP